MNTAKKAGIIEAARVERGYSQEKVAKAIGVSRPTYVQIESGEKDLSIGQAKTLSSMLRISIDDIMGEVDGTYAFRDIVASTEKYKQIILNCIKYGASEDGRILKTKLAKLVYLADFIWYYLHLSPMSGFVYRKLKYGPVADVYFRALDEMEEDGTIIRKKSGKAFMYSTVEKHIPTNRLSTDEIVLIEKIGLAWKNKSREEIVDFTHEQLPWRICRDGELIPYNLITQEEPERVYGSLQL